MSIAALKAALPDFAKDVKLNLSAIESDDTLATSTKWGLLLACAASLRNSKLLSEIAAEAETHLSPVERDAARSAATIMAMNNVYYRFVHLASNKDYAAMPAKLRRATVGSPGVPKKDFELWSLAVSALNGCGLCIDAHEEALRETGLDTATIQTAVRYAAILQSAAIAIEAAA
jgi:alkyl hydroperoxide reductase subunit D